MGGKHGVRRFDFVERAEHQERGRVQQHVPGGAADDGRRRGGESVPEQRLSVLAADAGGDDSRRGFHSVGNPGGGRSSGDNQQGYHQLPQNLDITHLSFDHIGDIVTIEYVMVYKEKNNITEIVSGQSVDRTLVGQEQGVFEYNQYLGESIRAKYNFVKTGEYYQRMQYWRGICLDVEPFAIAHIQYYKEDDYNDYVVGETGVLHMLKNVPVQDMCFMGRRMKQQDISRQRFLEDWEYVVDESGDTSKPKRNTVYTINGELKIYYKDDWYNFTQKDNGIGVAEVPIEGIINYLGNVVVYTY